MSDQGNGERATNALVLAEVRGLRDFTDAKFTDVQRQLDTVSGLPLIVNGLVERMRSYEERIVDLEAVNEKRRAWRIGPGTANVIGMLGVIVAIVAVLVANHA
jgi:hypothetical protein